MTSQMCIRKLIEFSHERFSTRVNADPGWDSHLSYFAAATVEMRQRKEERKLQEKANVI